MKKIIYIFGVLIFLGLFISSPYILDYWQFKSAFKAAEATGGISIYEGMLSPTPQQCIPDCCGPQSCVCCTGPQKSGVCMSAMAMGKISAPTCLGYEFVVTQSAGGQTCKTGYFVDVSQNNILMGAENGIIGGTTCIDLKVVASETGCLGCTAAINSPKIYVYKNKMKAFLNYIIAGFKD